MKIALILTEDLTFLPVDNEARENASQLKVGAIYEADVKNLDMRTIKQNSAMHKYFSLLSDELNKGGFTVAKLLKVTVVWTPTAVKEMLWRPIQEAVINKKSSAKLNKDEVIKVYDNLNLIVSERCGVSVPFPNKEKLS